MEVKYNHSRWKCKSNKNPLQTIRLQGVSLFRCCPIRNPPEWQGLSAKEANEIAKRFDSYVLGVYGKSKVEEEFGVNWDKEEEDPNG